MKVAKNQALLVAFVTTTFASPTPLQYTDDSFPGYVFPSNGDCKDHLLTYNISYPSRDWILPPLNDNYDAEAYNLNFSSAAIVDWQPLAPPKNVTKPYTISGTFCAPKTGGKNTVLVLTHGVGFDRRYWASSYQPETYSFVQNALAAGYSVFYYDRLSLGKSPRYSGYETQFVIQVELLAAITRSIEEGTQVVTSKPNGVALIGHSYGSMVTGAVVSAYPDLVDTIVLTGAAYLPFSNGSATNWSPVLNNNRIASTLAPPNAVQFGSTYDSGYLSFGDRFDFGGLFLHPSNIDTLARDYAFSITQPVSVQEYASAQYVSIIAPDFKGRVHLSTGQWDYPICNGNCKGIYQKDIHQTAVPQANFTTYLHPDAGHGINFHKNAKEYFEVILGWL